MTEELENESVLSRKLYASMPFGQMSRTWLGVNILETVEREKKEEEQKSSIMETKRFTSQSHE